MTTEIMALPFLDPDLSTAERVQDLLSRLTLEEKIGQMMNDAKAIPRLGIPAYNYWSEGLHGVARNGRATVFPQAIGLAATWDRALVERIASAIGDEARAKYRAAIAGNGQSGQDQGLTLWSPNINIFRDPRWGRGQETYGEDPHLTGEIGAAFVRGLQGSHPKYLRAAACVKHFAAHSGPEKDRHHFDARVSPRDLHDTYLPAFRKLVTEAKVEAVMGAYNRLNGEPCCASHFLLMDTLRDEWGFQGHVVSDCDALVDIYAHHQVATGPVEAAALALQAGCDLECGHLYDHLAEAVQRGLIAEADVDRSLARVLATRFKLGLFDPSDRVPYASIPETIVASPEHCQLAHDAALESIVLLKNRNNFLPLGGQARSIFVTGPNAATTDILLGNYYGLSDTLVTLLEGIVAGAPEGVRVNYRAGCPLTGRIANRQNWAVFEAAQADVVVACMGLSPLLEGEEGESILSESTGDRQDLNLPSVQVEFIKAMAGQGARIVLVLTGGSPIALGEVEELVEAILFVWYPGQAGGRAVADVLFGSASPSGKLPVSFPRSVDQLPPFDEYGMAGRTYRYSTVEPLYPFGFGLSYAGFAYQDLHLERDRIAAGETLRARCTLSNTGQTAAMEVAQFYLSDLQASVPVPRHKLIGFRRVRLDAAERATLEFTITPEMMMLVDESGQRRLEPGEFCLTVGGCSPGPRGLALGASIAVVAKFEVQ